MFRLHVPCNLLISKEFCLAYVTIGIKYFEVHSFDMLNKGMSYFKGFGAFHANDIFFLSVDCLNVLVKFSFASFGFPSQRLSHR